MARAAWGELRAFWRGHASFRPYVVRMILGFAGGMTGISITTVTLTQMDKVVLSKMLSLESFGYYVVASTLASGLYIFISPMFAVLFPRFAEMVARDDKSGLLRLYHLTCQLMSAIILPVTATLVVFAPEILLLWTGSTTISMRSHVILSFLVIGNAINGLMNVQYAMQLAHGWTKLPLYTNIIAVCICLPAICILTSTLGAVGAALVWMLFMVASTISSLFLTHRRFGLGKVRRWYILDVGCPALAVFAVLGTAKIALPPLSRGIGEALLFVALTVLAGIAAVAATPLVRKPVMRVIWRVGSVA